MSSDWLGPLPDVLPSKGVRGDVLAPDLLGDFHISRSDFTVLDGVAHDNPIKIFLGGVDQADVKFGGLVRSLGLSLGETFHVPGNGFNEDEFLALSWDSTREVRTCAF